MDDCIKGPREGHDGAHLTDLSSYRAFHGQVMSRKTESPHVISEPRYAYINHGRWVVDCDCNGAGFASRVWKTTCCFDCGAVYTDIKFPRNAEQIEKVLLKRQPVNRNWKRGETIKGLLSENDEEGLN